MMALTVAEVEERVRKIGNLGKIDPEAAHAKEDELLMEVLEAITDSDYRTVMQGLAHAALRVRDNTFPRWCG